jgi:hypothetical protein
MGLTPTADRCGEKSVSARKGCGVSTTLRPPDRWALSCKISIKDNNFHYLHHILNVKPAVWPIAPSENYAAVQPQVGVL